MRGLASDTDALQRNGTMDWRLSVPVLLFANAANYFTAVFNCLRVGFSDRARETRASCGGYRVGRDASGFCERAKYSEPLEARA